MKTISTGTRLQAHFSNSLALARKISKREHRANPFVNILNITAKSTRIILTCWVTRRCFGVFVIA